MRQRAHDLDPHIRKVDHHPEEQVLGDFQSRQLLGRVIEQGDYDDLSKPGSAFSGLIAAE